MEVFCFRCTREPDCQIVSDTFMYAKTDPKYPKEWRYDEDGHATCTAFEEKRK